MSAKVHTFHVLKTVKMILIDHIEAYSQNYKACNFLTESRILKLSEALMRKSLQNMQQEALEQKNQGNRDEKH